MAGSLALCAGSPEQSREHVTLRSGLEIIIGIICLAVGAGLAYFFLAGKSNSLKSANEQIESARRAERITSEARRQADTAKKEAVLEAKEEILRKLKQNSRPREKT